MNYPDPELLRTFVAFIDAGSLARAAEIVGRTPSAVTAQMQRLTEIVGQPLLESAGRGRIATPAGDEFAAYARRILELNRHAIMTLRGADAAGSLNIGATEDFAEAGLPEQLRVFAQSHPRVRIELRIGRSHELANGFNSGETDMIITLRRDPSADEVGIITEEMIWVGPEQGLIGSAEPLPLALLDAPCGFRTAALSALAAHKRAYWIAATSQSLAGLRTSVMAGMAITPRTKRWLVPGLRRFDEELDLPALGPAVYAIRLSDRASRHARTLSEYLAEALNSG